MRRLLTGVAGVLLLASGAETQPKQRAPAKPPAKAAAQAPRVSQKTIEEVADALALRTDHYWHRGDYDSVAFMYEMVVKLDPGDVTSWSNWAWITWAGLNNDPKAEEILKKGLAANPNRYELYEELGQFYYRLKRYKEARDTFKKAVAFKDAPPLVWNQYAHALEKSGDVPAAASTWRTLQKRYPSFQLSQVNLDRLKRHGLLPTD